MYLVMPSFSRDKYKSTFILPLTLKSQHSSARELDSVLCVPPQLWNCLQLKNVCKSTEGSDGAQVSLRA